MAQWIVDTTVLSNFAHARRPDLLQAAAGTLFVGPEVMRELGRGEASGRVPVCDWSWLRPVSLSEAVADQVAKHRSALGGAGEAEALAIAVERGMGVLTDDRAAVKAARSLEVPVTGTLGVLWLLVQLGHLTLVEGNAVLDQMKAAGYWTPSGSLSSHFE